MEKQAQSGSPRIESIEGGCPICHAVVKGNDHYLFFCKKCNVLFKRMHLTKQDVKKKSI
jgi:hypothetical protein